MFKIKKFLVHFEHFYCLVILVGQINALNSSTFTSFGCLYLGVCDEEASIIDPARVYPCLYLKAHEEIPGDAQQLDLDIAWTKAPDETCGMPRGPCRELSALQQHCSYTSPRKLVQSVTSRAAAT